MNDFYRYKRPKLHFQIGVFFTRVNIYTNCVLVPCDNLFICAADRRLECAAWSSSRSLSPRSSLAIEARAHLPPPVSSAKLLTAQMA